MSTNYYVRPPGTPDEAEGIHLGKSAVGWPFMFRAYPDAASRPAGVTWDVKDFDSWSQLLNLGEVVTEYGSPVTLAELAEKISSSREFARLHPALGPGEYRDDSGHRFTPHEFF